MLERVQPDPPRAPPSFDAFALKFLNVAKPTLKKQSWDSLPMR